MMANAGATSVGQMDVLLELPVDRVDRPMLQSLVGQGLLLELPVRGHGPMLLAAALDGIGLASFGSNLKAVSRR